MEASSSSSNDDRLPNYPELNYHVYRCVVTGALGGFYVERPDIGGSRANDPVFVADACMVHDLATQRVRIFDSSLLCAKADWDAVQRCVDLIVETGREDMARVELEPTHEELWHKSCSAAGAEPRHVLHHWSRYESKPSPELRFLRTQPVLADPSALAVRLAERERRLANAYPSHTLGAEDLSYHLARTDQLLMRHHPPVHRDTGDPESRLRQPSRFNVPNCNRVPERELRKISDAERSPPLSYRDVAAGVLMQRHNCTYAWATLLWSRNAENIVPTPEDLFPPRWRDPRDHAANVLLNYADLVLRARDVPKLRAWESAMAEGSAPSRRLSKGRETVVGQDCCLYAAVIFFFTLVFLLLVAPTSTLPDPE